MAQRRKLRVLAWMDSPLSTKYCRRGHRRTAENTKILGLQRPKVVCLDCRRNSDSRRIRPQKKLRFNPPPQLSEISDAWANWLAGFIDGEGCFLIAKQDGAPNFALSLRSDDGAILEEIYSTLQVGRLNKSDSGHKSTYTIYGSQCWTLCQLLDSAPLRAKKSRDYEIWRKAVDIYVCWPKTCGRTQELLLLKSELETQRRFINAAA